MVSKWASMSGMSPKKRRHLRSFVSQSQLDTKLNRTNAPSGQRVSPKCGDTKRPFFWKCLENGVYKKHAIVIGMGTILINNQTWGYNYSSTTGHHQHTGGWWVQPQEYDDQLGSTSGSKQSMVAIAKQTFTGSIRDLSHHLQVEGADLHRKDRKIICAKRKDISLERIPSPWYQIISNLHFLWAIRWTMLNQEFVCGCLAMDRKPHQNSWQIDPWPPLGRENIQLLPQTSPIKT